MLARFRAHISVTNVALALSVLCLVCLYLPGLEAADSLDAVSPEEGGQVYGAAPMQCGDFVTDLVCNQSTCGASSKGCDRSIPLVAQLSVPFLGCVPRGIVSRRNFCS